MITYQRLFFTKINKILGMNCKTINGMISYNFSSDEGKNNKYEYPFNFNREEYRGYIKKVEKAKQEVDQVEKLEQGEIVPRRKRRLYDRPKHDTDLTGYAVWRLFDPEETIIKLFEHSMEVVAKLKLQPKWVVHAFGKGMIPMNNRLSSHREYVFEDNNLSKFILYEYRNTTHYRENIPDYDYENQDHIRPEMRKIKRVETSEFWESEEFFEFRLNATSYAQHLKFCRWITETIEKRKNEESYDQIIDKKFGKANCFNEKEDMEQFQPRSPFIMHVTPQSFEIQKEEKPAATATKSKKEKKGQAKEEAKVETTAQVKVEPTPLEEEPAKPKSNYNFASQLEEQYRKEYKPEQKKAKSTDF